MAKVKIVGGSAVLVSSAKLETLKTIKKYRPNALKLMGGKENKDELFRIGFSNGTGNINKVGVEFDAKTFDEDGLATVTMKIDDDVCPDGVKQWMADKLGASILYLNQLEETLDDIVDEIEDEKTKVLASIELA